jgi:hypothetical protein
MAKLIDRVLLGGAFVCSGLIHRKVGHVEHRVEHVERVQEDVVARAAVREETNGMPLPTGYGIQVTGPGGEDIVIPVCLPPGFELASLVIAPSFLPDGETAPTVPARAAAPAPTPVEAGSAPAERLDGGMRLVYGESQPYSAHLEQDTAPPPGDRVREAAPLRESVL